MDARGGMRRLAQFCLVAMIAGASSYATEAHATVLPTDGWVKGNALGNGRHNHNSFIINSPSWSHDVQHIRNVNVGGNTVTPAAICKHAHHCKIIQHLVTVDP